MRADRIAYLVAAVVVAVAVGISVWMVNDRYLGIGGGSTSGLALVGGPFTLTDHTGARVSDTDLRGKLTLVYFGYTFCPDVCPTELQVIAEAVDLLGDDAGDVVPVFITVDPARDTVETLGDYVVHFHDRMIGLTGTADEIADVARAYRVYFAKVDGEEGAPYLMDHTSLVYLMGRESQYLRHFTHGTTAKEMAAAIGEEL